MSPAVSVVMPVHDGERFVREAVGSILAQTVSDLELIVIDDGSTDETGAILAELASHEQRLVVGRTEHIGQADARNAAVAMARAELIAFLDADDVAYPDRLERQIGFLREHEEVALLGGALTFVNGAGRVFAEDVRYPLTDEDVREAFSHTTPVLTSAAMVRRSAFEEAGGFRRLFADSEDLDLWLRISERHAIVNLPETVVRYRIHGGQASFQRLERQSLTALAARMAADARARGENDPFEGLDRVDRPMLLTLGATDEDVARTVVVQGTWLATALHRGGDLGASEALFADAFARAEASGSKELIGHVESERSRLAAEGSRSLAARIRSRLRR